MRGIDGVGIKARSAGHVVLAVDVIDLQRTKKNTNLFETSMTKVKATRKEASDKTKRIIWAKAAGRCQYPGCNDLLWHDFLTGKEDGNYGFIAHIVAAKETGPRGDANLSTKLADDTENLMLLCYRHHHLIDAEQEAEHPVDLLIEYKKAHEARIELQTSLQEDKSTEVVLFAATIGKNNSPISFVSAKDAILPEKYPQSTGGVARFVR